MKCCSADPPVDTEMLGEEGSGDHPRPVVHPAGRGELAHRRVDDREAGPPGAPGIDSRILFPGHPLEGRAQRRSRGARFVPKEMGVEVAPGEIAEEAPSTLPRPNAAGRHLRRREQPPAEVLAEAGRPVEVQPVAVRRVAPESL